MITCDKIINDADNVSKNGMSALLTNFHNKMEDIEKIAIFCTQFCY